MSNTTGTKTTASKTSTKKAAPAKSVAKAPPAENSPAETSAPKPVTRVPAPPGKVQDVAEVKTAGIQGAAGDDAASGLELKKQELIDKVVDASGVKKKDAKPVVEAMLEILGEALADGRELNLPPLGKVKLNRTRETANARIIVAKIRQGKNAKTPADPLAAAAE